MKYLLICLCLLSSLFADPTYIYQKNVEGRKTKTTWTLDFQDKENTLHISGESPSSNILVITTPDRVTQSFNYENTQKTHRYAIFRDGPYLIASQTINGEVTKKQFHIGNSSWVQEFDFCFNPYILSNSRTFKFSIVNPKNLSLHNMVATKGSYDKLAVHGKLFDALKVRVTLTGFKKMFWHADLWFDPQTGDLLKYMANEGPNTPLSTITLLSKTL